jgi:hypothetical protein
MLITTRSNHHRRWIVFSEDDAEPIAEAANIRRQNRIFLAMR